MSSLRGVTCARVSTPDQVESGYSLQEQESTLREFFVRNEIQHVAHLVDPGISGKIEDRPAIREIIHLAEARQIDLVAFVKLNRLGRENRVIQDLLHRFRSQGLRVLFVEHGSGDTPADRLLLNVLGGVAEYQWEELRALMMANREQKARERGVMPCGPWLFGYHLITRAEAAVLPECRGRDGELSPIAEEAEIIRALYERFAAGESLHELTRWMNDTGLQTRRGGPFRRNGLKLLLKNPAYMGERWYGRQEHRSTGEMTESGRQKVRKRDRPPEEWIRIPCPAIVSRDLWEAAQRRFEENEGRFRGRDSTVWLLRGIVQCSVCVGRHGNPITCVGERVSNNPRTPTYYHRYYRCAGRHRIELRLAECKIRHSAERLEEMAWGWVSAAAEEGALGRLARAAAETALASAGASEAALRRLGSELAAVDAEERQILDLALKGLFSPAIIEERMGPLRQRRAALSRATAEQERLLAFATDPQRAAEVAEVYGAHVREQIASLDAAGGDQPEKLQALYRQLLRITLYPSPAPPEPRIILPSTRG